MALFCMTKKSQDFPAPFCSAREVRQPSLVKGSQLSCTLKFVLEWKCVYVFPILNGGMYSMPHPASM